MKSVRCKNVLGASLVSLSFCLGAPANAQRADDPAKGQLEEIVVTAQRRGENLQKVPLAVTAFTGDALAQSGITKVDDIGQVDASINFTIDSGTVVPFLRGIGAANAGTLGNESSVPVYIDGVYYTRLNSAYLELGNIERVEVLKGPQGTLFGRNASGGLIQVITRDPSLTTPAVQATAGYGNYSTGYGKLYASTPIADGVAADISVSGSYQGDGWGTNIATGDDTNISRFINVRSKLLAELSPTTTIHLSAYYVRTYLSQGSQNVTYGGTIAATQAFYGPIQQVFPLDGFYDSNNFWNNHARAEGYGGSVTIDHNFDFANLTSISAYRKGTEYLLGTADHTGRPWLRYDLHGKDRQFSQELQLKSKQSSAFDWIVGLYYLNADQRYDPTRITGDGITAGGGERLEIFGTQKLNSYSAYGQSTFHVIPDGTNITLGLRYTSDHVRGIGSQGFVVAGVGTFPGQVPYDDKFTFNKLTYKVALDHQFADGVMGYISFSRGFKSGTFNTLPLDNDPAKPEVVDAYEVGIKSELFDRRLRLNVAAFQSDFKSPQVKTTVTRGTTSFVGLTNAGAAKIRGVELNADALIAEGLRLNLGATYLDARYTDFANAPFAVPPTALPQDGGMCPGVRPTDPSYPAPTGGLCPFIFRSADGNRMVQVPKWHLNAGVNYTAKTDRGDFSFDTSVAYTGHFFWSADNTVRGGNYALVNGSITYSPPGSDRWSFRIWGKNLTDKKFFVFEAPTDSAAGHVGSVGSPMTFGGEVTFKL